MASERVRRFGLSPIEGEFGIQNDEICIRNDEVCINNADSMEGDCVICAEASRTFCDDQRTFCAEENPKSTLYATEVAAQTELQVCCALKLMNVALQTMCCCI